MKTTNEFLRRFVTSATLLAALIGPAAQAAAPAKFANLFSTDFKQGADAWTLVGGSFKVADGAYRGYAMDESTKLTRAVVGETTWRDYRVTARLKLEQTANARADYGVVARYQDKDHYYMALYKTDGKKCTIEAKIKGKLRTLAEAPLELDAAQWHEFQFTVSGPSLALVIDGKPVVQVADTNLANGAPGLLAYYDEIQCTRFEVTPVAAH